MQTYELRTKKGGPIFSLFSTMGKPVTIPSKPWRQEGDETCCDVKLVDGNYWLVSTHPSGSVIRVQIVELTVTGDCVHEEDQGSFYPDRSEWDEGYVETVLDKHPYWLYVQVLERMGVKDKAA